MTVLIWYQVLVQRETETRDREEVCCCRRAKSGCQAVFSCSLHFVKHFESDLLVPGLYCPVLILITVFGGSQESELYLVYDLCPVAVRLLAIDDESIFCLQFHFDLPSVLLLVTEFRLPTDLQQQ